MKNLQTNTNQSLIFSAFFYLNWVEIWIIKISEEPKNAGPKYFSEQNDKGSKVEDVDHPVQPVNEHAGHRCILEGVQSKMYVLNYFVILYLRSLGYFRERGKSNP